MRKRGGRSVYESTDGKTAYFDGTWIFSDGDEIMQMIQSDSWFFPPGERMQDRRDWSYSNTSHKGNFSSIQ